jgi:2-polyprenyl-3-methyl-5-hydroxy-6-metoxy-1,4-benzoquinol methylase
MIKELDLRDKIEFVGWVNDLNTWFEDKSHILSFSLEESFHYAIGDGMSAGLKPVIHAWNESRDIWPEKFIFKDLDEFIDIVGSPDYDPKKYRKLIVEKGLDARTQIGHVQHVIKELIENPVSRKKIGNQHPDSDTEIKKTYALQKRSIKFEQDDKYIKAIQNKWMLKSPLTIEELNQKSGTILSNGQIVTMKCERIHTNKMIWEVEFGVEHHETGAFLQFIVYDEHSGQIYTPFKANDAIKSDLIKLIRACLRSPNIKLNDLNLGMIFDRQLLKDVQANYQEYVWERMYPATVFSPLKSFLKHMGRYEHVKPYINGKGVVVDAACGIGYGAKYLSTVASKIYAFDLSQSSLSLARKYYDSEIIEWLREDVTTLPIADKSVDCFVSMETFEHLDSPDALLSEIKRVLKPGGKAFISTPNGDSPKRKMINNPYHLKEYNYKEINSLCSQHFKNFSIFGQDNNNAMVKLTGTNSELETIFVQLN